MAYYFEELAFYSKMEVFSNAAFSLSTFTVIAISIGWILEYRHRGTANIYVDLKII